MSVVHAIMDPVTSGAGRTRCRAGAPLLPARHLGVRSNALPRSAVLLAGDAGVGKTRLLTELRDRVGRRGLAGLAGHCLDFGDSALPYLPFTEVVRPAGAPSSPTLLDEVAERHPALARAAARPADAGRGRRPRAPPARPRRPLRRRPRAARGRRRQRPAPAGRRGRPLGRPVHPRPAQLPVLPRLRRARSPSSRPTAATTCTAGTRCAARLAEWARLPRRRAARSSSRWPTPTYAAWSSSSARPAARGERSAASSPGPRATRSSSRSWSAPPTRSRGRLPERPRRPAPGPARPARRRRAARSSGPPRSPAAGSRTRCSPHVAGLDRRPSSTGRCATPSRRNVLVPSGDDCYAFRHALLAEAVYDDLLPGRAGPAARGVRRGAAGAAAPAAPPPSWPATPACANDSRPRSRRACGPATRRCGVGGADEAAHHYLQALELWHDTAARERQPTSTTLAWPARRRRADRLGSPGARPRCRRASSSTTCRPTLRRGRGRLLGALAGALAMTETDSRTRSSSRPEAVALVPDEPTPARARVLAVHARMLARADRYDEGREVAMAGARAGRAARHAAPGQRHPHHPGRPREKAARRVPRRGAPRGDRGAVDVGAANAELRGLLLLGHHHLDRGEFADGRRGLHRRHDRARAAGTPWVPYAAEARWMHAVSLRAPGPLGRRATRARHRGRSPPRSTRAAHGHAGRRSWSARGDAARGRPGAQPPRVLASGGPDRDHGRGGRAGCRRASRRPGGRPHDVRLIVETLTGIWHPLFQARVRLAATTLAVFASGAAHRSATERARTPTSWSGSSPTRRGVIDRSRRRPGRLGSRGTRLGGAAVGRAAAVALGSPTSTRRRTRSSSRPGARRSSRFEAFGAPYELASVRGPLRRAPDGHG